MTTFQRKSVFVGFVISASAIVICCTRAARPKIDSELPQRTPRISVVLSGSADEISSPDLTAPELLTLRRTGHFLSTHHLSVIIPNGRTIDLNARSVSFTGMSRARQVLDIVVRKPLKAMRFQQAREDLVATLLAMGCEPNQRLQEMKAWGDLPDASSKEVSPFEHNAMSVRLSDTVEIDMRFYPDAKEGWYYLMTFGSSSAVPTTP